MGKSARRIGWSPHPIDAGPQFPFRGLEQLLLAASQLQPAHAPQQLRVPLCLLRGIFRQLLKCSNRRVIAPARLGEFLALIAIECQPARQQIHANAKRRSFPRRSFILNTSYQPGDVKVAFP